MKKALSLLLVLSLCVIMCASVVSCDNSGAPDTNTTQPNGTTVETPTATETEGGETDVTEEITTVTAEDETTENADVETTEGAKIETTEGSKAETTEESKAETTEEPKAETTEEPKAETTEESKAETTEEHKAETTEEPKAETTEEPKVETTEEPKVETTEETKVETTEGENAETTEGENAETTEGEVAETTEGSKEENTEAPVTTVEKSEWEKLFSADNIEVSVDYGMYDQCYRFDGDKVYVYMELGGEGGVAYIEHPVDTDEYWITEEVYFEGNWVKDLDKAGIGSRIFAIRDDYFCFIADKYDAFTYDEESKTYVADSINSSGYPFPATDVTVRIENGKLIEAKYFCAGYTILINNVGTVEVEIPTADRTVTEEEWVEFFSDNTIGNFKITSAFGYDEIKNGVVIDYAASFEYIITEDFAGMVTVDGQVVDVFAIKADGVWYTVYPVDGEWVAVETTEKDIADSHSMSGFGFAEIYPYLTYDEERGCYFLQEFNMRFYFGNGKLAIIEILSDDMNVARIFQNYGKTTTEGIYIPEYVISDKGAVDAQTWIEKLVYWQYGNVTLDYTVEFESGYDEPVISGNAKFTYEGGMLDGELASDEEVAKIKDDFMNTVLCAMRDRDDFVYDVENDQYFSIRDCRYSMSLDGYEGYIFIVAENMIVKFGEDGNVSYAAAKITNTYTTSEDQKEFVMYVQFTFTDYGTTFID